MFVVVGIIIFLGCEVHEKTNPNAEFSISPSIADTSTFVVFDGSKSFDLSESYWALKFRWDFDGDLIWDTDYDAKSVAIHRFQNIGKYVITLEVIDLDGNVSKTSNSISIGQNFTDSVIIDERDGQKYKIVLIDSLWWMSENLRFGEKASSWDEFIDDSVVKMFGTPSYNSSGRELGAFYSWNEASNYGRDPINAICPEGWRLISYQDYDYLGRRFFFAGDPEYYFKPNGYLGLDLELNGRMTSFEPGIDAVDTGGYYWLSEHENTPSGIRPTHCMIFGINYWPGFYHIDTDPQYLRSFWKEEWGLKMDFNKLALNVRCVKNY